MQKETEIAAKRKKERKWWHCGGRWKRSRVSKMICISFCIPLLSLCFFRVVMHTII
jgi:hypothetical protein